MGVVVTGRRREDSAAREERPRRGEGILGRLRERGIRPRRRLGQHFLLDPGILDFITEAAALGRSDTVLEVGTGPGTLTRRLAERAGRVLSVEVDPALARFAREELGHLENLEILERDVLDAGGRIAPVVERKLPRQGEWKLVANLPYQIATPLLLELFCRESSPALGVVTVQDEVARRLGAAPGGKAYGPPTVLLRFWALVELLRALPAGAFHPPPRVASRVIRLRPRPQPLGPPEDFAAYAFWVRRLFSRRRKQIGGILRQDLGTEKGRQAVQSMAVAPNARAEDLLPEAFLRLARRFPGSKFS